MILINLLPHREVARKRRRESFQAVMVLSAIVGLLIAGAIYLWFEAMIDNQQARNTYIASQTAILDKQIKEIANIEEEITALSARQKAVEDLQADRNLPVHMLNQLVLQIPDGAYLTSLGQTGQVVTLKGMAQSNERVSELLRNLSDNTPWFSKPQLGEIITANVTLSPRDQRRVPSFTLNFHLARTAETKKATEATGVPPRK